MNALVKLAFVFLLSPALAACTNADPAGDVGDELASLGEQPGTLVVVRDTGDVLVAFPSSGMRHVSGRTVAVTVGTQVATGSGSGPEEKLAEMLLDNWQSGGPYFMAMNVDGGDSLALSGQVGAATEEILLEVEDVVLTRSQ